MRHLTVNATVVFVLTPPAEPVMLSVNIPGAAFPTTLTVIFEVVLPVMEVGLKLTVTFFG